MPLDRLRRTGETWEYTSSLRPGGDSLVLAIDDDGGRHLAFINMRVAPTGLHFHFF